MPHPELSPVPKENTVRIGRCEIKKDPILQRMQLRLVLSPEFSQRDQLNKTLEMLRTKVVNSFKQEREFYLPENMATWEEVDLDQAIFEAQKNRENLLLSKKRRDENDQPFGYETTLDGLDGQRQFRKVEFLANGIKIGFTQTKKRKGLLARWFSLSAEVSISIGISKRVPEAEAKKLLREFSYLA